MFSLLDLGFLLCSFDRDVLLVQRIMGFLILITHKSMRSEKLITWLLAPIHTTLHPGPEGRILPASYWPPLYFTKEWLASSSFTSFVILVSSCFNTLVPSS